MPDFYLFGGPNGAGKTTTASQVLPVLGCQTFLNADILAHGFSPLAPDSAALQAGVALLKTARKLAAQGENFGTESTLAAKTWVPLIRTWRESGYRFHLFYVWLPSAEMAVQRVAARVRSGGHNIPEDTIRRRYDAGRRNFAQFYRPNADFWTILDNSQPDFRVVAKGDQTETQIFDEVIWNAIHQP